MSIVSGDVRALVCCDSNFEPIILTEDHIASSLGEIRRIESIPGGFVKNLNGRIRVLGKLALTRALGDKSFSPYVISSPYVSFLNISERLHRFIIIGTDGLFDSISNVDVIKIAWMEMSRGEALVSASEIIVDNEENSQPWYTRASRRLVFEAKLRGITMDNIGVAVIPLSSIKE